MTEMWHFIVNNKLRGGGVDYKHKIVDPHEARKGDGHMINIVIHLKGEDILDAIEIQQVSSEALEEEVRHWRAQVEAMHAELDALAIPRMITRDDPRILSLLERFRVFFEAAIFGIPDGLMETYLKERPS